MSASASAKSRMERILRLQEQIDEIKGDIRQIYAEEKADGGDKTAMGAAISYIRKRTKDKDAFDEREALALVYINAFEASGTALATHAHAREGQSYAAAKGNGDASAKLIATVAAGMQTEIGRKALVKALDAMIEAEDNGEITEHERPETATKLGQDVQSPIQRALADENLDVTAGETAQEFPLQTSPETGSAGDPSPTSGQMDLVEAGTGQNCAVLPQEPCTAQITPSAAPLTAEPEAVSPTPPAASGTISPSSGIQGVTGGNPSEPSPDAGAENGIARAMAANAQSEQAAHRFDDDVPAFLKQERAERQPNPKCQKPGNCKWDHGQVSCWRCNSAPAARESEVA